mmetsp:Transcript_9423/g.19814  ORF Transcript_9423/g.19814 Transcript_9423/m.19814 type:complete len:377 (-) Transcript_9423:325-1455(-)|eukprot:CAMPEP_0171333354 /NCGR_PEP_ID=MMETSP0878-20121228/3974_1 /TAXON_ID=67004 /ORGANISM="Thalassiosira weissflogii, Strain CCMP1336" /LENGTH=376 /DNA_ID=CAMNT_0011834297 /DNA_START=153 /DNA_END=1283 /DNA_ORIENTATION=-
MNTRSNTTRTRRPLGDVSNRNPANAAGGKPGEAGALNKPVTRSTVNRDNQVNIAIESRQEVEVVAQLHPVNPVAEIRAPFGDIQQISATTDSSAIAPEYDLSSYQYSTPADDIDERDSDDPLCVTSYVQDMYEHFRLKESSTSVRPGYMQQQPQITENMRAILVDWLVEVHNKFKMVPETLYLTVNIIDRYLERNQVTKGKLQLVGVTALLIASKYEEIYPPELRDLVYICDRAYTKLQILNMEETILKSLQYQVTIPSAHAFLVRYLKAAHADRKIVQLSCYILDGTLQRYDLLKYLPSELASAAVLIARMMVGRNAWSPTLLEYANYREEDIMPVARDVVAEHSASSSMELAAVTKKYSSNRYGSVANTPLPRF